MEPRELFLHEYQTQVLDSLVLPPCLGTQYRALSCLKDGKRQVYLMQDQAGWLAVLKIQPAGREDSLKQEYDLLQRLHHRQIPRPLSYLEWEEKEYLMREYVEGISLSEQVTDQGTLSANKVREAALSLCQVLTYLHNQDPPVICRDVKPQNVILDSSGVCHLIDLGAARRYRPEQQGDTVFIGTEVTAPPEQFGYQQTDQRSDIYSLGMLLRFLYTGDFDPQPSAVIPGVLGRVIRRCTAFDPQNRFSSVQSVSRVLKYHRKPFFAAAAAASAGIICMVIMLGLFLTDPSAVQPQSPLLEEALRCELNLNRWEPIPENRLKEVKQLLVCRQTVVDTPRNHEETALSSHDRYGENTLHGDISDEDLKLLAQCTNLQILILDYQQITDLSPLSGLPLSYLSLAGNRISDLRPLSDLTKLQTLDLSENPVRSAEVLAELTALQEVTMEAVDITSVEVFAGSDIRFLNIRGNKGITDFSPLKSCPALSRLTIGELSGEAVQTLKGLTNLTELNLYSAHPVDLNCFTGFQKLCFLDLYGSTVSHPEALASLPNLRYLNIGETGVNDLSFLQKLPAMTDVDLRENPITDLTPLLDCPKLTSLCLSKRHQPLAQKQLSPALFKIQFE